jgi:hypothetical protein
MPVHQTQERPLLEANGHSRRGDVVVHLRDFHAALVVKSDTEPDRPKSTVSTQRLFRDLQHTEAERIQRARSPDPD